LIDVSIVFLIVSINHNHVVPSCEAAFVDDVRNEEKDQAQGAAELGNEWESGMFCMTMSALGPQCEPKVKFIFALTAGIKGGKRLPSSVNTPVLVTEGR